MSITKAQATREINRRKGDLPKGVTVEQARTRAQVEGTFSMSGPDLKAIASRAKATAAKVRKAPATTEVTPLEHVRVIANEVFRVAKEQAGVKAGFQARKAFCEDLATLAKG
jgi:hypothetical protein